MPHFLLFPPILDSTEARTALFCDFTEYCPRGKKKFAPFSYVRVSGVHFNAFGVFERVMNAVCVCIAERPSLRCVLFTFLYNVPKFLLVKTVV